MTLSLKYHITSACVPFAFSVQSYEIVWGRNTVRGCPNIHTALHLIVLVRWLLGLSGSAGLVGPARSTGQQVSKV